MNKLLKAPIIINAVLFQVLWFACVLGGANNLLWPSIVAGIVMLIWQRKPENQHENDIAVLFVALIMGLVVDTSWSVFGLMEFQDGRPFAPLAPGWILIMWLGFALTINHSMSWLSNHPLLPAAMGLIGGPMAYLAGLRLGAVEYLANFWLISALLAIVWAIALTILVRIGQSGLRFRALQTA